MKSVREARRVLLTIAIVLLVAAAGSVAWLLSPRGRSTASLHTEYGQLRSQYEAQLRELGPARDINKRLAQARTQQTAFYDERIPVRYSTISEALGDMATHSQVQVSDVKYDAKDTEIPGLQRVKVTAEFTGDYVNEMKFVNGMERSKLFFVIDSVNLGGTDSGKVRLEIHFETFLRSA